MAKPTKKKTSGARAPRTPGGGPTAAGGYNFQAAVAAISLAHLARGTPIGWLEGLTNDTPQEVACETQGPGDDLRLELTSGEKVEIQVKKGLQAGSGQREAMYRLAEALHEGSIAYGILAVCPFSSRTIAQTLADDLVRLGERDDAEVDSLAADFRRRLIAGNISVADICGRLRIVSVAALAAHGSSVAAARAELAHLCAGPGDALAAWNALYREASAMIARRGVRRIEGIAAVLATAGLDLASSRASGAASLVARVCSWAAANHNSFTILGVSKPLSIEHAWREMNLIIKPKGVTPEPDPLIALQANHGWNKRDRAKDEKACVGDSVGRFHRHAVVLAGPGMGKSTLLTRLAQRYAIDGYPVLLVRAQAVAAAMQAGASFEAAVFELGLDGSTLSPQALREAPISEWVLLCDGLDEAGTAQEIVAKGLRQFQLGRPRARIVTTSRPIGYRPQHFHDWRHYEIAGLASDSVGRELRYLLGHIQFGPVAKQEDDEEFGQRVVGDRHLREVISHSPLMLGIAAALVSRGQAIGHSRTQMFRAIFQLLQAEPPLRAGPAPETPEILARVLDLLGVQILDNPLNAADAVVEAIGVTLADDLQISPLRARGKARECLSYWEALGVVETIRHEHQAMFTMTHLMFAEFAAGRYIASLSPPDMAKAVEVRSKDQRWTEALSFAAAEGAGDLIIEGLLTPGLDGQPRRHALIQCLDILVQARTPLRSDLVQQVLDASCRSMASDDVSLACEVALKTAPLAAAMPDAISQLGVDLLNGGHPWCRLAGWTLVTQCGSAFYDVGAARNELVHLLTERAERRPLGQGYRLNDPERDLFRVFAGDVVEAVLASVPIEEADEFIEPLLKIDGLDNFKFWFRIQPHLSQRGSRVNPFANLNLNRRSLPDLAGFADASRQAYSLLIGALVPDGLTLEPSDSAPPGRSMFNLGAVSQICRWGESTPSDVWSWRSATDLQGPRAAFAAIMKAYSLDPEAVGREALLVLRDLEAREADPISAVFGRMPHVDPPEERDDLDRSSLDMEGLILALHHPSELVVPVAATIVDRVILDHERRSLVPTLLASSNALSAWAGIELAKGLGKDEAASILLSDFTEASSQSAHRIAALRDLNASCTPLVFGVLRPLLFGQDAETAKAVADYLAAVSLLEPEVSEELRAAELHWIPLEEPYPSGGGIVPPSPRAGLLQARIKHGRPSLDDLIDAAGDERHDVQKAAIAGLGDLMSREADIRRQFVGKVAANAIDARILTEVLRLDVVFSREDLKLLEEVFASADGRVRLAGMALLDQKMLPSERRGQLLKRLRADVEPAIRARAARLLETS